MTEGLDSFRTNLDVDRYWNPIALAKQGFIPVYPSPNRIQFKNKRVCGGKNVVISLDRTVNQLNVLHRDAKTPAQSLLDLLPDEIKSQIIVDRPYPGGRDEMAAENAPSVSHEIKRTLAPIFTTGIFYLAPLLNYLDTLPRISDSQVYVGLTNILDRFS